MCSQGRCAYWDGLPCSPWAETCPPTMPSSCTLLHLFESLWPQAGSTSAAGGCGLLEDPGLVGTMVRGEEVGQ